MVIARLRDIVTALGAIFFVVSCGTTSSHPSTPIGVANDDHRTVLASEFFDSSWKEVVGTGNWELIPGGLRMNLSDSLVAELRITQTGWVSWNVGTAVQLAQGSDWVDHAPEWASVDVQPSGNDIRLASPLLEIQLNPTTLAWQILRGSNFVFHLAGGPDRAKNRWQQRLDADDAVAWVHLKLHDDDAQSRYWPVGSDSVHWTAPILRGIGGPATLGVLVDTTYQSYLQTKSDDVRVGTLNGPLRLWIGGFSKDSDLSSSLASLVGRPALLPSTAHLAQSTSPIDVSIPPLNTLALQSPFPVMFAESLVADNWNGTIAGRVWASGAPLFLAASQEGLPRTTERTFNLFPTFGPRAAPWGRAAVTVGPSSTLDVKTILEMGLTGVGTPAVELDMTDLPSAPESALDRLKYWIFAPVLRLDLGSDPGQTVTKLSPENRKVLQGLLDRRSELEPYLEEVARTSSRIGLPEWRPLWWDRKITPQSSGATGYLLGDALAIFPSSVTAKEQTIFLPSPGVWFDFWTGEEFGSGREYSVKNLADRPIVFARAGAFVATQDTQRGIRVPGLPVLTIHVYPGARGEEAYWIDDGHTKDPMSPGGRWETRLTYEFHQRDMTISHESQATSNRIRPAPYFLYRLHNVYRPKQVRIDGKNIPLYGDSWGVTESDRSAAWYENDHTLLIKTFHPELDQTITMTF